ncbi:MAG: TonB-dependent receptor [Bryobacterales bacterium]|nr:TonB-dependent receptor [Bryobacterales bacterium]
MHFRKFTWSAFLLACCCTVAYGQTITSSIVGTVTDPAGSVVPAAEIRLTNTGTAAVNTATSDSSGFFRIANIYAGTYSVNITAKGFKNLTIKTIEIGSSETRDLGRQPLTLGEVTESISVTSEVAAVQTATSERAAVIDGAQLNQVAIKGRDMMSYMRTLPGVVDTNNGRDAAGGAILGSLSFSGNTGIIGMSVDGATDIDTGCSNCFAHFEPNIDSIAEIKVLTSNPPAEYGRNSGATISVTTKGGTQEFHGSGWWTHRHEGFNANQFFNNQTGVPVPRYRFNIAGFSLGGPVYVPKYFNKNKTKLFFFVSQEYTKQLVNFATQTRTMPTAQERAGDFSQSIAQGGAQIRITDPQNNGAQFPGNIIPQSRINGWGQALLNFFPLPNTVFGPGTAQYQAANFQTSASGAHPRRNDIVRFDVNATSKLNGFFRYGHDYDDQAQYYKGIQFNKGVQQHPNPGTGYVATVNYTFSPTLVNQATYNFSYNYFAYFAAVPAEVARSLANGTAGTPQSGQPLPSLFPLHPLGPGPGGEMLSGPCQCSNGYGSFLPQMSFGSIPLNTPSYTPSDIDYINTNRIKQFSDNLTWIKANHSIKAGIYVEYNRKLQPGNTSYVGNYNFGNDTNNPLNTGNGFSNALLGNFSTYQENSGHFVYDTYYWNTEFFVQDDWRIGKKLTLNYGVRFYHISPQIDKLKEFSYLDPSKFSKSAVPRLYTPFCKNGSVSCSGTNRVGIDASTGQQVPASNIGLFVPNSGNTANGMVVAGLNGASYDTYTNAYLVGAPRIGFAYDVFGNGKTAIRGGWGMFFDRLDGNQVYNMSGQPPVGYAPTVYYGNISTVAGAGGLFGPPNISQWSGPSAIPQNRTASLGIQSNIGFGTVIDVSYQGTYGLNRPYRVNLNPVPLGSDFNTYVDPTQGINATTQQVNHLPASFQRPAFPGYGDINSLQFGSKSRYDGLQTSVRRRLQNGFLFSAAYTWSHSFALAGYDPLVADNYKRNWGPQASDRRHLASITYAYDIPKIGKKMGMRYVGAVTDGWNVSGITTISSGAPFTPTFTATNGINISGTTSQSNTTTSASATQTRIDVVGDPFKDIPAGNAGLPHGKFWFNPAAFAIPAVGTSGNAGINVMYGPGYANYDMTVSRKFRLGSSERRTLQVRMEAFNVFNHTQFTGVNSAFTFAPVDSSQPFGAYRNTNANIGALTGERGPRILSLEARIQF